jgi:hypothetical protein
MFAFFLRLSQKLILPAVFLLLRFQVLTATSMKMTLFWDVAPKSLVKIGRRFTGTYYVHHQADEYLFSF